MNKRGFVFIELIVVLGILSVLISIAVVSISNSRRRATLTASVDTLVSDIKSQQTKAMTGLSDEGVRFETTHYVLFDGATYSSSDPSNFTVPLDERANFSVINVPNARIVFASRSGEILEFSPQEHSVTLTQLDSNDTKTIQFNRYGTIQ